MKKRLVFYKTKYKTKREHTACGGATTLFFLLIVVCWIYLSSCSSNSSSPTQSTEKSYGPPGPDYFTLTTNYSGTWTDSTPICFRSTIGIFKLPCVAAATPAYPPANNAQPMLFAIVFENSWGNIPTGDVTKDVSVQLLNSDSTTFDWATWDSVTVSRVDSSGIYGSFKNVMFEDTQADYWSGSGSFHVPAPK